MATKITKKRKDPAPKGAGSVNAADELEVLHPNRELAIAGRVVTVREYGFLEGLEVQKMAKPFFEALYAAIPADDAGAKGPSFEEVQDLIVEHPGLVVAMVATAADVEPEWIESLDDRDGLVLLDMWWMANVGFFIRRVWRRRVGRAAQSAGEASTQPSSAPDTAPHPSALDGTPAAR